MAILQLIFVEVDLDVLVESTANCSIFETRAAVTEMGESTDMNPQFPTASELPPHAVILATPRRRCCIQKCCGMLEAAGEVLQYLLALLVVTIATCVVIPAVFVIVSKVIGGGSLCTTEAEDRCFKVWTRLGLPREQIGDLLTSYCKSC